MAKQFADLHSINSETGPFHSIVCVIQGNVKAAIAVYRSAFISVQHSSEKTLDFVVSEFKKAQRAVYPLHYHV